MGIETFVLCIFKRIKIAPMKYFSILLIFMLFISCNQESPYDVVIRNGTLYDGSGNDPIKGDLAIVNDKIVALGVLEQKGKIEIDATGKAVAPGFINMLSWANESLLHDGRSQSDLRQGVTLVVMGEGESMGPLNAKMKAEMIANQGDIKYNITWNTLSGYLNHLEKKGVSTNVASFVGNGTLRSYVMGYEERDPTEAELQKMKDLLKAEMKSGALGVSSSLLYAPSMHAGTDELTELAKVAAQYDGMYISHIRDEGDRLIESVQELIDIAKNADSRAEVYHLKASSKDNWYKLDSVIAMINKARTNGLQITADMYTYNASSTGLHVTLPQWVREGGIDNMLLQLQDPEKRKRAVSEIYWRTPPEGILLVGFKSPELRKYLGKRLSEVAKELKMDPADAVVYLIEQDQSRIQVVYFSMSEANVEKKIKLPWMSFCSDAGSYSTEGLFLNQSTHPRAYGSFARVLGLFSRDKNLYSLQDAIHRFSGLPAQNLKLQGRGFLKAGNYADVVVFDPKNIADKATFAKPHQYATGVDYVWVNGVLVLDQGKHTGVHAGRFIKGPGFSH